MADFVTLSCPSCGGKLEITKDVERFACANCGREHIVNRSGGIVSLSPVVDALKKVGVGVDKTAAELAIVRLRKEIEELQEDRDDLLELNPRPRINLIFLIPDLIGFCLASYSITGIKNNIGNNFGLSMVLLWMLIGIVLVVFSPIVAFFLLKKNQKHWDETTYVQLKSLDSQIAAKNAEIKRHHEVISL